MSKFKSKHNDQENINESLDNDLSDKKEEISDLEKEIKETEQENEGLVLKIKNIITQTIVKIANYEWKNIFFFFLKILKKKILII